MLGLADRYIKSLLSQNSAVSVLHQMSKNVDLQPALVFSKFPPSQLLFSTSTYMEPNSQKKEQTPDPYIDVNTCLFICLENVCLSLTAVYRWVYIWSCSAPPLSVGSCLALLSNIISFQTGALELLLSLNFSLQLNRTPTVLSPPGHCGNKNHNHSNKKNKRCVIVRKSGAAFLQFTVGPSLATPETPQEGKL